MLMPALRHHASLKLWGRCVLSKLHTVSKKRVSRGGGQWGQQMGSLLWSAVDFGSICLRLWILAGLTAAQRKRGQAALAVASVYSAAIRNSESFRPVTVREPSSGRSGHAHCVFPVFGAHDRKGDRGRDGGLRRVVPHSEVCRTAKRSFSSICAWVEYFML